MQARKEKYEKRVEKAYDVLVGQIATSLEMFRLAGLTEEEIEALMELVQKGKGRG